MDTLASRDSYIQKLTSKVCAKHQEPRKRAFVPFSGDTGPSKKKKARKQKRTKDKAANEQIKPSHPQQNPSTSPAGLRPSRKLDGSSNTITNGKAADGKTADETQAAKSGNAISSFSAVDVLRKRLQEKIEESRGQGPRQDASSDAVQAKRAKRKLERERKKRKKKEFQLKKLAEKTAKDGALLEIKQEEQAEEKKPAAAGGKRDEAAMLFNTVETVEGGYVDKQLKKKSRKKAVKGGLTPLTGRNYRQLLGRLEARQATLERLRETDEGAAQRLEEKMTWTNALYKAEGLRVKDDEGMLRAALKRKERTRATGKRRWEDRSRTVVEKMQRRQDKRRGNLQKRKTGIVERKKDRARKKGRILPEDLAKASV